MLKVTLEKIGNYIPSLLPSRSDLVSVNRVEVIDRNGRSAKTTVIHISEISNSVVIHEIFHAIHNIMDIVGIKLTDKSDEAYAYLLGFYCGRIIDKINKNFNTGLGVDQPRNV